MSDTLMQLTQVTKSFKQAGTELQVLSGCSFAIQSGEMIALTGPSGSGKSTMLQIAGLLDRPSSGQIAIAGEAAEGAADGQRTLLRRQHLGFVYQFHHLLPEFSALENVVMPQIIAQVSTNDAERRAKQLLDQVGLSHRIDHRPSQLSGGEQQRVAIARALANKPKVLLADEPTGNLDPDTAEQVFGLLREVIYENGLSALIATHNLELAKIMNRRLVMQAGTISEV